MKFFVMGKGESTVLAIFMLIVAATSVFSRDALKTTIANANSRKLPIYSVQRDDKKIAITFDCAWGNSDTDELLGILKKHNAKATFFFTGQWLSKFPEDVLKIYADGHEIANHSDEHKHIDSQSAKELKEDILSCNKKIKAIINKEPLCYRGPYGEYNNTLLKITDELKMFAVQWDIDSRDWQKKKTPEEISQSIIKYTKSGSIILFHNDTPGTPKALDLTLTALKKDSYTFVAASDLIYKQNYNIDHTGKQIKKDG